MAAAMETERDEAAGDAGAGSAVADTRGSDASRRRTLVAFALCCAFVAASALFVIGPYQNMNGDFGQYFLHAQNLLKGRPWGFLVAGKPAVLPLYPAALAALTSIFGPNAFWYALLNSTLWAGASFLAYQLYKDKFDSRWTAYVFLATLLFNPFVVAFQQDGQPNITYSFIFIAALCATANWNKGYPTLFQMLVAWLPAITRVDSIAFYAALFLYLFYHRRWRLLWLPVAASIVSIGMDGSLSVCCGMKSNFSIFVGIGNKAASSGHMDLVAFLTSVPRMALAYIFLFAEIIFPNGMLGPTPFKLVYSSTGAIPFGYAHLVLALVFLAGVLIRRDWLSLDKLAFAGYLGLISTFLLSGMPPRYLLPILPIFWFYVVSALERPLMKVRLPAVATAAVVGALLVPPIGYGAYKSKDIPKRTNGLFTPSTGAMADWLAQNLNGRRVGYTKDRLMTLLLDIRDKATQPATGLRTMEQADKLLAAGGVAVLRNAEQKDLLTELSSDPAVRIAWQNPEYTIFELVPAAAAPAAPAVAPATPVPSGA